MTAILLVEDHTDTRQWLKEILVRVYEYPNILEAATVAQAIKLLKQHSFALAVLDINLPDGSGIDIAKSIARTDQATCIVMATIYDDDDHLFESLTAGAHGYLLKEESEENLIFRFQSLLRGEPAISPAMATKLIHHFQYSKPQNHDLTPRELEVLTLVAKGLSRREISTLLEIKQHTVSGYIKTIYSKLNVNSKAEAALEAARMGLINVNSG